MYSELCTQLSTLNSDLLTRADQESLQKMLFKLFHLLLSYSFQEEVDGWKLWVDIAASLHAYVSVPHLL